MSLVFCPECGHEVSANAAACPNCAHPMRPVPVVERKVVVPPPVRRESGFPPWLFIPIGLVAVILMVVVWAALRDTDEGANVNVNVNAAARRSSSERDRDDSRTVSVPTTDSETVTVPVQTTSPGQTTTVPGTMAEPPVIPSDKATVVINARVAPARGSDQAARNAKFFLLDDDLESILIEARLEPIDGNSLTASLGLAVVYPDQYGDFYRSAMRAINSHVKYSGTTDGKGLANLKDISPDQYYLFGITRVGQGFALWNSPVSVIAGQNVLNLSPQSVTEIPDNAG